MHAALDTRYEIGVDDKSYKISRLSDGKYMAWRREGNVDKLLCIRCEWRRAWAELHSAAAREVSESRH